MYLVLDTGAPGALDNEDIFRYQPPTNQPNESTTQSIKSADSLKVCLTAQLDHPQNQTFAFHNEMKCTYIAEKI